MAASVFEDYFRNWDRQLNKKRKKIALVLDNCPAHPKLNLENIELTFTSQHYVAHSTSQSGNLYKLLRPSIDQT
jgi:hypothetical protein